MASLPPAGTHIESQVRAERFYLALRQMAVAVALGLLTVLVPLLVLAAWDYLWPLRESTALLAALAWLPIGFALGIALLLRAWRRLPTMREVALRLEAAEPAFMDGLVCAVELAEQPNRTLGPLELAMLRATETRLAAVNPRRLLADSAMTRRLVAGVLLTLVGLVLLPGTPLAAKLLAQTGDWLNGTPSGLLVTPGDVEVAQGEDLLITARVTRGPDAAVIVLDMPDGELTYDMYGGEPREHSFEVYAIQEGFRYQVRTATLRSPWHAVRIFTKPVLRSVAIHAAPPRYTGMAPQHVNELRNLSTPVGSAMRFEARANMPVTLELVPEQGDPLRFEAMPGEAADQAGYVLRFTLEQTMTYRLRLTDPQGHVVESDRVYRLEALPDYAPVVQVLAPEDNAIRDEKDDVTFSFNAVDDYGLASVELVYAINGGNPERFSLYESPALASKTDANTDATAPAGSTQGDGAMDGGAAAGEAGAAGLTLSREEDLLYMLRLSGKVKYGDVITYWAEARDTALPEANVGASDLRFIEVRPPEDEAEDDGAEGPPIEGEVAALRVSDLIEDQKQLIRQTFGLQVIRDEARRADLLNALAKAAGDLNVESRKRFNELRELAGSQDLGELGKNFEAAVANMGQAQSLLEASLAQPSLPWQQDALAKLIAIEIELIRNSKKMKQQSAGKPSDQQKSKEEQDRQTDQQKQDQQQQMQEMLAEIEKSMDTLDTLIQRQTAMNQALKQNPDANAAQSKALANRQGRIAQDTRALEERLERLPQTGAPRQELDNAGDRMEAADGKLEAGRPATAMKDGAMAEQYLQRSRQTLEDLRKSLTSSQLETAMKDLEALRSQQQSVSSETAAAQGGEAKSTEERRDMASRQGGVREGLEQLQRKLEQAAGALEKDQPEVARQVQDSLRQMDQQKVDGAMKRAENALRYGRYDKAGESQAEADAGMQQLADQLGKAIKQSLAPSPEQIAGMLQQALKDMQDLRDAMAKETDPAAREQLRQEIADRMEEMAGRLQDGQMQQLSSKAQGLGAGTTEGGGEAQDRAMLGVLEQSARLLESRLVESQLEQRLRLSRVSGREAPDAYRKLVDQYFKNLSDVAE